MKWSLPIPPSNEVRHYQTWDILTVSWTGVVLVRPLNIVKTSAPQCLNLDCLLAMKSSLPTPPSNEVRHYQTWDSLTVSWTGVVLVRPQNIVKTTAPQCLELSPSNEVIIYIGNLLLLITYPILIFLLYNSRSHPSFTQILWLYRQWLNTVKFSRNMC